MKQYIIIGNGIAAAGCIEGIRSKDPDGAITVISKENHPVYCRPLISYYLEGKTKLENIGYRDADFYEKNGCDVLYGEIVTKIDPDAKTVILSSGKHLSYTELCIAAGSTPFIPPFEGLYSVTHLFSFMTLDDALELEKAITPESKVLIIGAGLIGLKCAEGLHGRVKNITVCDLSDRILSSILDSETAPMVQKHLEDNGIELLLSDSVKKFDGDQATLNSGKIIDFDILVAAVGVRPNTSLLAEAGGKVNRGILIDENMKTSLPDVYAVGDCAEGYDVSLGGPRVLALLPNAYMQGHTAGVRMTGNEAEFSKGIPMNSIGLFGMHIMTAGSYMGESEGGTTDVHMDSLTCRKFFIKDGLLKGYILINDIARGGIYTSLIREQTPLDSINFDLLKENPSFLAFSVSNRRKMFGGVVK